MMVSCDDTGKTDGASSDGAAVQGLADDRNVVTRDAQGERKSGLTFSQGVFRATGGVVDPRSRSNVPVHMSDANQTRVLNGALDLQCPCLKSIRNYCLTTSD